MFRASKPFDTSEEVTLELVDKKTNTVLETKKLNKTSGDVSFQKNFSSFKFTNDTCRGVYRR